jgi:serine/threonine protein kinase
MVSIINAVSIIQDFNIIHRDIKLENILMNRSGEIKLADFGEARQLNSTQTCGGTCLYRPPEAYGGLLHGNNYDVWSVGIVALMFFCHPNPYDIYLSAQSKILEYYSTIF